MKPLRLIALTGNVVYILWFFYNAIDERGQGIGAVQAVAISGLTILLLLNFFLLYKKPKE
jgi:hypothetical protein